MTLYGWDASHYDWDRGPMDLKAARQNGISFFTHKASEGASLKDSKFVLAMQRAMRAGIPFIGAYHVVRSGSIQPQVNNYLAQCNAAEVAHLPNFFIQADVEKWPYDSVTAAQGRAWADAAEQKLQRRCVLYGSRGQYGDSFRGMHHALWNAAYGSNGSGALSTVYRARGGAAGSGWTIYSGQRPAIWQFGSSLNIGLQRNCDGNAFEGTLEDFARLIGAPSPVTPTTPGGDNDMKFFAKDTNGAVYLCDGMTSRWIPSMHDLGNMRFLRDTGVMDIMDRPANADASEWEDDIRLGYNEAEFGLRIGPVPPAPESGTS
jgi:GH25 family lysozyme M1 (1,4-beta-N-acetylmuramidase)